jgi:intracellular septation protein A
MWARIFAIVSVTIGTLLSLYVAFFKDESGSINYMSSMIEFAGPWLVASAVLVLLKWYRGVALAGMPMVALEISCYYGVFITPTSSTDPLVYVVKPGIQFILLGFGLLLGWIIDKRLKSLALQKTMMNDR